MCSIFWQAQGELYTVPDAPSPEPAAGWRVAVTWDGTTIYIATGGPDGEDWALTAAHQARIWTSRSEASRVAWAYRRAQAWRPQCTAIRVEPAEKS